MAHPRTGSGREGAKQEPPALPALQRLLLDLSPSDQVPGRSGRPFNAHLLLPAD